MVLDAVLAERRLRWLGTERDKVEYFSTTTTSQVEGTAPPGLRCRTGEDDSLLPGQAADRHHGRRSHPRVPVPREPKDAGGLPRLPTSSRRAAASSPRVGASPARAAPPDWRRRRSSSRLRDRSWAGRLRLDDVDELRWYFRQQDQVDRRWRARGLPSGFAAPVARFRAPRFHGALSALEEERRPAPARHSVAGARGHDRAPEGPCDERSAGSCSMPISHPWLARRRSRDRRERRGERQAREERSPSWALGEAP